MSRWIIGCALSSSLCGWLGLACASPAVAGDIAVEAIEAALAAPTEIEFIDTPIGEVCDFLRELHKINLFIDQKSLEDAGASPASKVTVNFRNMSLESALRLTLGQLELTFVISDESLVITSKERADNTPVTKVYPVGDLLGDSLDGFQTESAALVELLTSSIEPHTWNEVGGPGVLRFAAKARSFVCVNHRGVHRQFERMLDELRAAREVQENEGEGEDKEEVVLRVYRMPGLAEAATGGVVAPPLDAETTQQLAKALQSTIEPESWQEVGGSGSVSAAGNTLFIRQTPAIHARVRAALVVFSPHAAH